MKIERVAVVFKKSAYEVYALDKKDPHFLNLIQEEHPSVKHFLPNHETHLQSKERVYECLESLNIKSKFIYRARRFSDRNYDLIISLGGDGTFLEASHSALNTPTLGVNSVPQASVGMFCGITTDGLRDTLEKIQSDTLAAKPLHRLRLVIDGHEVAYPVLNDVLITNSSPASTSRFLLKTSDHENTYVSSGLWVAPPSGTTGGIRSAGGVMLPLHEASFQYVVREAYYAPEKPQQIVSQILSKEDRLVITSQMRKGTLFLDGAHHRFAFPIGKQLEISMHSKPLMTFAYNEERRKAYGDKSL